MNRLLDWLLRILGFLAAAVIVALVVNLVSSAVYDECFRALLGRDGQAPTDCRDAAQAWARVNWPWLVAASAGLAALVGGLIYARARTARAEEERRLWTEFRLAKPMTEVRPEDVGFQPIDPGHPVDPDKGRPFYAGCYIPRAASPDGAVEPVLDEDALAEELRAGHSVVILGQPLDGKSVFLYQTIKRLTDHLLVMPPKQGPGPSPAALDLLRGKRVVLLLDDLDRFLQTRGDLNDVVVAVRARAERAVVAATCRSGAEQKLIEQATSADARQVFAGLRWKLTLRPAADDEERRLCAHIGQPWEQGRYASLGSIATREAAELFGLRFRQELSAEQRDLLRVMKLLTAGGVTPLTLVRLETAMRGLAHCADYQRYRLHQDLEWLEHQSFIEPRDHETPPQPEPAYLRDVVAYWDGVQPEDHFDELAALLEKDRDYDGLGNLGFTIGQQQKDWATALAYIERALSLTTGTERLFFIKGHALYEVGRYDESVAAYERALGIQSSSAIAWGNLGISLRLAKEPEQALAAYDRALALQPDYTAAHSDQGNALADLARPAEALAAFDRALVLMPDNAGFHFNRGVLLGQLMRPGEALAAYDRALALNPDYTEAHHNRGNVLWDLKRPGEALTAYDRALNLQPDEAMTWCNKAFLLAELQRYEEALVAVEEALRLEPDKARGQSIRQQVLAGLGRVQEGNP
jgi:tetratricopeptide (TPR) repeat protein